MSPDALWSVAIGGAASGATAGLTGNPFLGIPVGIAAMLGAAWGFDRQRRRRERDA